MLEDNCVYNLDALDLLKQLPDNHVDCIVTSPPYGTLRTYTGFTWDFENIARESYRVLKTGGVLVWVVGDQTIDGSETLEPFRQALFFREQCGFKVWDTMIYHKNANVMNNHHPRYLDAFEFMFVLTKGTPATFNEQLKKNKNPGQLTGGAKRQRNGQLKQFNNVRFATPELSRDENVWRIYSGGGHNDNYATEHPASFPEALAERHILTWTNPGDLVLDYFGGSGTTAKMARKHARRWITGDLSPEYCDLMRKRLAMPYHVDMFATLPDTD